MKQPIKNPAVRFFLVVVVSIVVSETVVAGVLPYLHLPDSAELLGHALLLVLLVFPALYLFLFHPMLREQEKAMEEQVKAHQSQKMEAFGKLAGGIAHDFNNLLTIINGYAGMRVDTLPKEDPIRGDFEEIMKAGRRAAELVSKLLLFSRRSVMQPKAINLNKLIGGTDGVLRRLVPANIEFVTQTQSDLGTVKVDVTGLQQVLAGLVENAAHAMPKGGRLVIETKNVSLNGEHVMFSVSDTGTGMSDETKKHLFEPFFTTKEKGSGKGLGLATCYGIVKQNGGSIDVSSELGHGTSFRIYLPRVNEQPADWYDAKKSEDLPRGKETVLVVEDEPAVRQFAVRVLQGQGYRTFESSNGQEALLFLGKGQGDRVDCVLTDVVMPQMGGKELAEKLRRLTPDIRIVFMSGYAEAFALERDKQSSEFRNFLSKPFTPRALAHKMREILDQ